MYAKALAGASAALILAACGGSPPGASLPPELGPCAPYARSSNTLAYCVVKQAANLPSPADVERVCPLSGALETECRRAWTQSRANPGLGFSTDALVQVCAGSDDCVFELLEARPEPDVTRQLALCASVAGQFAEDCAVHALERWATARPVPAEAARLASVETAFPERVGYALGVNLACYGGPACAGADRVRSSCEQTASQIRDASLPCPRVVAPPGFPRGRQ